MFNINELGKYREGNRLEVKKAEKGLPHSLWPTYSAFANTNGGYILLGVEELPDKSLHAIGLNNPEKWVSDFWSIANNSKKVNINILLDKHVRIEAVDGKQIVVIEVPRAERGFKPVFLDEKPYSETYRRDGEGDFRCTAQIVEAMIRDKGERTQDMLILEKMSLDVFDYGTLRSFRNRMRSTRPGHVWDGLQDIEFLQKLGAINIGEDEKRHPTAAGLLMFGHEYEIVREYHDYFLDYQEQFEAGVRFTDRITSNSGEWSGNVYDFFFKVYNKLSQHPKIKTPFKMEGIIRVDDTPLHKALREALANCLSNADFYGERGLVVRNRQDEIVIENPGGFRIELSEAFSGGVSSPRNSVIMKMFTLLDIGERTGSGIPTICQAWQDEGFGKPKYTETFSPDRTILSLAFAKTSEKSERKKRAKKPGETTKPTKGLVREQDIIDFLADHKDVKTSEISENIDLSEGRVRFYLQRLIQKGMVVADGETHNRIYRLKP
ncbi:MAG: putative DNA binding domain-containing protein [Lachnospiraceae bacterium]|jgi:predicted HTH transcriptional regulator|nr:putative DNA binding domain-containing protein [Lachnospiraceae bacterium]